MIDWRVARIHAERRTGMGNGGWCYDAYPELKPLNAGATIPIAEIEGCGVITCIHSTQHLVMPTLQTEHLSDAERRALSARGVVLLVYFDGSPTPSVCVPLGDFFADGCGGMARHFSSWGFRELFSGLYAGINYVRPKEPAQLSIYRFHLHNPIRFTRRLVWQVDWRHELRGWQQFHEQLAERHRAGKGWIDYAVTTYWYQQEAGYPHAPLPPLEERLAPVLYSNQEEQV